MADDVKPRADRESAGKVFLQLFILAAVLAGGFAFYYQRVQVQKKAQGIAVTARDKLMRDTPKDFFDAEKDLAEVLKLDSKHEFSVSSLAEMNALLWGEYGLADREGPANDWAGKADAMNARIDERFAARALILLYKGKAQEAVDYILAQNKSGALVGARMHDAVGRALRAQGKIDAALKEFKTAKEGAWRNPRMTADYAQAFYDISEFANAYDGFNKAVEIYSAHPVALIGRARSAIQLGVKIKESTDALKEVLARPEAELPPYLKAMALEARAELRLFEHDGPEAFKDCEAALALRPNYAPAHRLKGILLAAAKKPEAAASFDKAIALDPWVPGTYFDAARSLLDAGDAKALTYLDDQHYGKAAAKDDRYYLTYGDLLRKKGEMDQALAQYELGTKANPNNARLYFVKGMVLETKKDFEKAGAEYDKAIKVQPNFPEVYQQIAMIYVTHNKPEQALESITMALDQYRAMQAPRERLAAVIDDFKVKLPKNLQKQFETEAKSRIR